MTFFLVSSTAVDIGMILTQLAAMGRSNQPHYIDHNHFTIPKHVFRNIAVAVLKMIGMDRTLVRSLHVAYRDVSYTEIFIFI